MGEIEKTINESELLGLLAAKPATLSTELRAHKVRLGHLLEGDVAKEKFICLIRALEKSCQEDGDDMRNVLDFLVRKNFLKDHIFRYVLHLRANPTSGVSVTLRNVVTLLGCFVRYAPASRDSVRQITIVIRDYAKSYPSTHQAAQHVLKELSALEKISLDRVAARIDIQGKIFPTLGEVIDSEFPALSDMQKENHRNISGFALFHFQMLRQEIVEPLRIKISRFHRLQQIKGFEAASKECLVFSNVSLLQTVATHTTKGVSFRVSFEYTFEEIEWETTHLLTFGNLVCLMSPNLQLMVFAVVAKRDPEWLRKGSVELRLLRAEDIKKLAMLNKCLMIDTETYIEEHFGVLTSLQKIVAGEELMAFSEQILSLPSVGNQAKPATERREFTYDVGPLVKDGTSRTSQQIIWNANLSVPDDLPVSSQLCVDDDQFKAIVGALTEEVTVIRGSPGTGKTYTCLKIVQLQLLKKQHELMINASNRTGSNVGPIIYVCSTRASLEEFLTRVSDFQSDGVIGYGGNAKQSDTLGTLEGQRNNLPPVNDMQHADKLKSCNKRLQKIMGNIKNMMTGILSPDALEVVMDAAHFRSFRKDVSGGILLWLLPDKMSHEMVKPLRNQIKQRRGQTDGEWSEGYVHMDVHPTKLSTNRMLQAMVQQIHCASIMNKQDVRRIKDVWQLPLAHRWALYRFWVDGMLCRATSRAQYIYGEMEAITKSCQRTHEEIDHHIMQTASVVGMTTSGAVKLKQVLKRLRISMAIVDEADDVLLATTAAFLPPDCPRLVLIGDDGPKLNQNQHFRRLAVENRVAASLIERLSVKEHRVRRLSTQHRMCTFVSIMCKKLSLISGSMEHDLATTGAPGIANITHNVCFVDYTNQRSPAKHEAAFLMKLSSYLRRECHPPCDITIVTTFPGQLSLFKDVEHHCQVRTVDEFRGESDIVLFMSSGCERKGYTGCLEIEQRLLRVLTSSRRALFIIGDFKHLTSVSALWARVVAEARNLGWVDTGVPMKCQYHPKTRATVTSFASCMNEENGFVCKLPCNVRLKCGHRCLRICHDHATDPEGLCLSPCARIVCKNGHRCKNRCHEPCETSCKEPVLVELPCGHQQPVPCHHSLMPVSCRNRCERILPCSHRCSSECGMPCGHRPCMAPCNKTLHCGHPCNAMCGEECPTKCHICEGF